LAILVFFGLIASASAQDSKSSFSRFTYSIGGPIGIGKDDTAAYVGNSFQVTAGGGVNFSRLFGVDAEYMYYNLGFRPSVKSQPGFLQNQSGNMQSISLDGIVKVPWHFHKVGAYGIFGVGFYRRSMSVPKTALAGGTTYQPAWRWFDIQRDIFGNVLPQEVSSNTKDAGGFNYGGGVTYPLNHLHDAKFFAEWRYHRAYHSDGQTIVMPVTIGLRW
jgi:hypothetical protein